jgi:holliday junction DNA helicase RuvA
MMIRHITGTVFSVEGNRVVIATASGVGYLVSTLSRLAVLPHDAITLYTHLAVRETALDLYGFATTTELELFELLLTISGVGPKSALQILEQADPELLVTSISQNDPVHLSKLSGIGKKTAEKIVLTLRDKIEAFVLTTTAAAPTDAYQDAFDTLITLGYNPQQVRQVLDTLVGEFPTTSLMVKEALRQL